MERSAARVTGAVLSTLLVTATTFVSGVLYIAPALAECCAHPDSLNSAYTMPPYCAPSIGCVITVNTR